MQFRHNSVYRDRKLRFSVNPPDSQESDFQTLRFSTSVKGTSPHSPLTIHLYICRVYQMKLRLSPQTLQVLDAFLQVPKDWIYGYDISRNTGLKSGTLYPILMRLAERKLLETSWETAEIG